MITISLCMIVKNEEEVLERCLNSLKGLMDEIIIVDTGSTDSTKEIAARYTDKIYDFSWCDDFAAARNFSFSKATQEYIYAPDADEVLDDTNRRRFMMLKAALLGIEKLLNKYPYEVSGGQKQRAAVARAIITNPELILADEPTGALDSKATDSLLRLFNRINEDGQTILMVTHSTKAASHANRVLFIKDGQVFHQVYRGNLTNDELYVKIQDALMLITTGGEKHE